MPKNLSIAGFAAVLVLLAAWVLAQGPLNIAPQEGVLLMRNGRVLGGKITREGERYFVALPHGEIRVEAADVQWAGLGLAECYQHKRSLLLGGNVNDHLDLAAWCIGNGLFDAAERELADASRLDPRHPKLPLLDRRLKTLRQEKSAAADAARPTPGSSSPGPSSPVESGPSIEELEASAKNLPPGTLETFTAAIQPMLQNHCSTAGCHGPTSTSSFRLQRLPTQRLVNPRLTLRNLHAALKEVNKENPGDSPLLQEPIKPHGTAKEAVFKTRDASQYRQLVAWVYQAAQAQPPRQEPATSERPPLLQPDSSLQTGVPRSTPKLKEKSPSAPAPHGELQTATQRPGALGATPASPLGFVPRDPFDPEIFNRKYFPGRHGSAEIKPLDGASKKADAKSQKPDVTTRKP
jgi:hypothetical protein